MRIFYSVVFIMVTLALGICADRARHSGRKIGRSVSRLLLALIPPVAGNLIIIASGVKEVSRVGNYVYFLGMDLVMVCLLRFALEYCDLRIGKRARLLCTAALAVDVAQLLLNPLFHHAFETEAILVDGFDYYRLIPYFGQTYHRLVDYAIFISVLGIFIWKAVKSPRVYSERYTVLIATMVVACVWSSYYIFSRSPIDRSMLSYGAFGFLVYYFSLYYRPYRLLDSMLAGIASEMGEAIFFFDTERQCVWANRAGNALLDLDERRCAEAPERLARLFGTPDYSGGGRTTRHIVNSGASVKYYDVENHALEDGQGRPLGRFLIVRDNTEAELELMRGKYAATHDALTDLYTRDHLYACAREALRDDPDAEYLALFIDINDFKMVNDVFGNSFGNYALIQVSDWIREVMPADGIYGRLGGDMFGAFIPKAGFDQARVEARLSDFIVRNDVAEHQLMIHLGVYEVTEPELDVSVMFDRAHMALLTIKDDYQNHVAWYGDEMRRRMLWEQHISTQLPEAIQQRQLRPYLQPLVNADGRIIGAEALVRWIHPTDGFLSPGAFIPVFEKNGMITEIDRYMWRSACELLARWDGMGYGDIFLSVNISPKDFYFMDVAAEIKDIVSEFGIRPARLRLEITETVMMTDIEKRIGIVNELKDAGFIVEMDDFGSGYSSLNLLKDMPVDVVKIDMEFLRRAKDGNRAEKIVNNIIRMSDDLGIASLSEGVETETQYRMLTEMGCKTFQGYYFSKPVPVEEFENLCFRQVS